MNIVINLKVSLPSGAKIEVTKDQSERITEAVERILNTPIGKRASTKRVMGAKRWDADEDGKILSMLNGQPKENLKSAIMALARELGRTPGAIKAHYNILSKKQPA